MDNNDSLIELSKNTELKNDYNFAQLLASEMHNFHIGKEIKIPENEIIKVIGKSHSNPEITMMPYQLLFLKELEKSDKIVLSAPTSFGKTFLILEFLKRKESEYKKITYIVHTKSLKDEVYSKLDKLFENVIDDVDDIGDLEKFIIVLVSDGQNAYEYTFDVDLLIVDEAYNLAKSHSKGRHFCIMNTYRTLLNKTKKTILLGPFINEVMGEDSNNFYLIKSDYSPVVQKIFEQDDLKESNPDKKFIEEINNGNKTIAYFGSKIKIYDYINSFVTNNKVEKYSDSFIEWMEDFFPEFWLLPKLMKLGVGLYHSAFPKYINIYNMNKFNNENFIALITTSAILEGVNTSSKSLVLFDSTAGKSTDDESNKLTAFQFFNLCGRVGRLGKEIVGTVYNFGDSYKERYKERSLPLYIGCDSLEDEFDEFDNSDQSAVEVKDRLIKLLFVINIDYDEWYAGNVFYSSGSKNMLNIVEAYIKYREILKVDIKEGRLYKVNTSAINKNQIIKHYYDNFVKGVSEFKYIPRSKFSIQKLLPVFLRSTYGGIDFNMKYLFEDSEIKSDIAEFNIAEKNRYVLEIMSVGYNYIPHTFYNITYLFNQFVWCDSFWEENEKKMLQEAIHDRVLLYVNGDTGPNAKLKKILSNMGLIPPTIKKVLDYVKKQKINVENISKKSVLIYLKEWKDELDFEEYELINLKNLEIDM